MNEQSSLERRCRALTEELGLGSTDAVRSVRPLDGGVASDIARVELPGGALCMKFARARLKVDEDWRAPVHRSAAEYAWLRTASALAPRSVPHLYGHSERLNGFAMAFVEGPDCRVWKRELLDGTVRPAVAAAVGDVLGTLHAASAAPGFDTAPFHNRDDFHALRLEPYLLFTATRHPTHAVPLRRLADRLHATDRVLVHGDVSPKNVLVRGDTPVLLDAECATMGDAGFDVAFCLNHLVLKAIHRPARRDALFSAIDAFWQAYRARVNWEPVGELDARVAALLPALMLARVDGKSPVDYLAPDRRGQVRALALARIAEPPSTLVELVDDLSASVRGETP